MVTVSLDRNQEKKVRQDLAYAGAGLLLRGSHREGFSLILASQALYTRQLLEVMEVLTKGDLEEAAWLAFGYTHHPSLEKRTVYGPPAGGWRQIWELLSEERIDPKGEPGATLVAIAHTAHLGELTALLAVRERKGLARAVEVARLLLDLRPLTFRYGLHAVSGPVPKAEG
ncbi:hypothetical protein [Thermus caldilimi]|uniref:hypothetical protein n=1 Tax=Thermus caldilimi TaxID=2483360 RepID=UPI001075EE6E|nr:hypothetical protein [Thermus caldilimi]